MKELYKLLNEDNVKDLYQVVGYSRVYIEGKWLEGVCLRSLGSDVLVSLTKRDFYQKFVKIAEKLAIAKLVKEYPNDQKLGEVIRALCS